MSLSPPVYSPWGITLVGKTLSGSHTGRSQEAGCFSLEGGLCWRGCKQTLGHPKPLVPGFPSGSLPAEVKVWSYHIAFEVQAWGWQGGEIEKRNQMQRKISETDHWLLRLQELQCRGLKVIIQE